MSSNRPPNWSDDELILAFNLYCKTPFTKISAADPSTKELASIIGRSASAVALKLANFARLDPALQGRNISGMKHGSKAEEKIWSMFNGNWDDLIWQSEVILAKYKKENVEEILDVRPDSFPAGRNREATLRVRVNQSFFRKMVLASYDNRCCITGIAQNELLIASHIIPWSVNEMLRLNPTNGLCLNALHDRAFDAGLMTITPEYQVRISKTLMEGKSVHTQNYFKVFEGTKITLPQRFYPDKEFLVFHNKNIFKG